MVLTLIQQGLASLVWEDAIHYFIILDGVSHGELIPLHLPSFSAFIRPLRQ